MISIDVLENKPEIVINGETIMDITARSIDPDVIPGFSRFIFTNEEMIMRPDLAAHMLCGTHNRMGTLLKLNSIGNPFSLNSNEFLFVPDTETINNLTRIQQSEETGDIRRSFRKELQDRISKVSENRKEYLNAVDISEAASSGSNSAGSIPSGSSSATQSPLPPNVTQEGSEQFRVENGKLIFGSDIGVCRTRIQQNKSLATIKSRFAQRQIFES
jgi:hypothetical protein